jgi:hypothetical protein
MKRSIRNLFQIPVPTQLFPAIKSKAAFTLHSGKILLGTFDNAAEVWQRFDVLLASGLDVTIEAIPAVL